MKYLNKRRRKKHFYDRVGKENTFMKVWKKEIVFGGVGKGTCSMIVWKKSSFLIVLKYSLIEDTIDNTVRDTFYDRRHY